MHFRLALSLLLVAGCSTIASAQVVGLNFTGASRATSGFIPPDTMGTVGQNHIVEMINGRFNVYDKTNGSQLGTSTLNQFWASAGAPHAGNFAFDPRVQYDPSVNRYYAASVDNAGGANNFLFAVSNTSNPLDGWSGFSIDSDTDDLQWADFPQMGFSADRIVISGNMFAIAGGPFQINTLVLPKSDILAPTPSIANATLMEDINGATGGFSWQAAMDLQGSSTPLRLFSKESAPNGQLDAFQIDGPANAPIVNNIADITGLTPLGPPPTADQPGGLQDLATGGNRTNSALKLIDDSYYGIHGVNDPITNNAALQWYRMNATSLAIEAEGLISDPTLDLYYSSIAANEFGDIVIGFSGSSETDFVGTYAVVGDTDLNGDVTFGDLIQLKAGEGGYVRLDSSNRNRWGDYSATVLDPSDPFSFWTFQEFASGTNEWSIQISQIRIAAVPEPGSLAVVGLSLLALRRRARQPAIA